MHRSPAPRGQRVFKKLYLNLKKQVKWSPEMAGIRLCVDKRNKSAQEITYPLDNHANLQICCLAPHQTREIWGKLYIIPNNIDELLPRLHRNFTIILLLTLFPALSL